jgi:Holliday junction DNA helicase RuvA
VGCIHCVFTGGHIVIGYISGKVLEHSDGKLLVGVGSPETGGTVGYALNIAESAGHAGLTAGGSVELFVYTHVREDALDLFGFRTIAEKDLFLTFLSVSGIGPKLALNILSGAEAGELIQAILRADKVFLSRIPGIGKKTAERIVLEVSDKIRKKMDAGLYAGLKSLSGANAPAGATARGGLQHVAGSPSALLRDAAQALVGLGYREQDAQQVLHKIIESSETPPAKVEDLIRAALRQLV